MPAPSGGFTSGLLPSPDDREEFCAAASPAPALAPVKGRVLLVEDDPSFKEILHDFLTENGYDVVMARNGAEGVNAVMACDFALILCDLMMPKVPGEAFYRAVERVRPHLCERFVFMTGYGNDATAIGFIQRINGYVLQKPFQLKDLLDAIALAEVRGTFESVFDSEAGASGRPEVSPRVDPYLAKVAPLGRAARVAPGAPTSAHPSPAEPPAQPAPAVAEASEPLRLGPIPVRSFAWAVLVLLLCVGPAAGLVGRFQDARKRAEVAAAERAALEAEWKIVSPQMEQAEKARGGFASLP